MGDSLPPPAAFDLISSFARLRDSDVEIVLAQPKLDLPDTDVAMTLRRGRRVVDAVGRIERDARGTRLVVRLPRIAIGDGTWVLALERADRPRERIAARLLVQGRRPLVLLWGARDRPTAVPGPRPSVPEPRPPAPVRRRVAAAGGRVLDRALTVLPADRAASTRAGMRSVARRVLR